ncbi:hypothetical protein [Planococcus halotolerans]|nr:hypothetical protein [Planococcus halotolerans]
MYQDFADGLMLGYLLMIAATSLLAFFSKLFSNSLPVIIGNMLSIIVSFYFINNMAGSEGWGWYFKPLSPIQLLITVSLLNLIPQFFAMKFANKYKITFDKRPFAIKKNVNFI